MTEDDLDEADLPPAIAQGDVATVAVSDADMGARLDKILVRALPDLSRSRLQALIRAGQVTADGVPLDNPGTKLRTGQTIAICLPPPIPAEPQAEDLPLNVVYEDGDVIVIDKPAGLVVHPAAGHQTGTLVNALIAHCGASLSGIGGVRRPGIVHRLDKETSGLLVVAKNDAAHRGLSEQFAAHGEDGRLHRAYLALVWGVPPRVRGTIDAALTRSKTNRLKIAVVREEAGRRAVTHYEVLRSFPDVEGAPLVSLVRLELETGRTHQIRVHMAHIGHPLLGDPVYGKGFATRASRLPEAAREDLTALGRQALHAAELGFVHPRTGKSLAFSSELPDDVQRLVAALAPAEKVRGASSKRGKR